MLIGTIFINLWLLLTSFCFLFSFIYIQAISSFCGQLFWLELSSIFIKILIELRIIEIFVALVNMYFKMIKGFWFRFTFLIFLKLLFGFGNWFFLVIFKNKKLFFFKKSLIHGFNSYYSVIFGELLQDLMRWLVMN